MKIDFSKYSLGIRAIDQWVVPRNPTTQTLRKHVEEAVHAGLSFLIQGELLPSELLNEDVREKFIDEFIIHYQLKHQVKLQVGKIFGKPGHEPWLDGEIKARHLVFKSYQAYRNKLADGNFTEESLKVIDKTTDVVLDHMGNPKCPENFKTYGLLMGDVQSGKTAVFTGICHKAVDAGYKMIIVLTGTKSSLRTQTQNRLNNDLVGISVDSLGRKTRSALDLGAENIINWKLLTTSEFDFTKAKLDQQINPENQSEVSLAVMQKNAKVLGNILSWLKEKVGALGVRKLPLLLIDDEADAASINSNKVGDDPTKINSKIREILNKFDRAAYLAVTATPFANVFIDPQLDEKGEIQQGKVPDLFPRHYIYPIPTPIGYLGVERLFGELGEVEKESRKYKSLIPLSIREDSDDAERKTYVGKLKACDSIVSLPASLRRAVLYFLCVCTLKESDLAKSNTSMLVHVARFKNTQHDLKKLIEQLIREVTNLQCVEGKRTTPELLQHPLYRELSDLWENGCGNELWYEDPTHGTKPCTMQNLTGFRWQEVWKRRFGKAIKGVRVEEINTNNKIKNLDAFYEKKDAKLIAVGGDALSRGLTLEGLSVSYFSRRSFSYDTLLQMGRWFGYREGMKDYMKVWISDCLIEAYGYVAEALTEFRTTVEQMRRQKSSPEEFGLKIRRAPSNVKLMVTAANKRRTAKKVRACVDMTGCPIQASALPKKLTEQRRNKEVVSKFLKSLGPWERWNVYGDGIENSGNDLVWLNVPGQMVGHLLRDFNAPGWSNSLDIVPVAKRIIERDDLWMVRVISVVQEDGKNFEDVFGLGDQASVICSERTMIERVNWIQQPNRGILSPGHFTRHLSREQKATLRKELNVERIEVSHILRQPGEKPQLLIYPLRTKKLTDEEKKKLIGKGKMPYESKEAFVSLVFGLPASGLEKDQVWVEYDTNKIYQMQSENGYIEGEDE